MHHHCTGKVSEYFRDFRYFTVSYERFANFLTIWMFAAPIADVQLAAGAGETNG
jgi:hypothetical protein